MRLALLFEAAMQIAAVHIDALHFFAIERAMTWIVPCVRDATARC
jgi:hypothetical protein